MFSEDLFQVFEEENESEKKSKKKLKRPNTEDVIKQSYEAPDEAVCSQKKAKIDYTVGEVEEMEEDDTAVVYVTIITWDECTIDIENGAEGVGWPKGI